MRLGSELEDSWNLLHAATREHLRAFMEHVTEPERRGAISVASRGDVPSTFAEDLVAGRPHLREAFPNLERTLVSIGTGARATVRFTCTGTHDGVWFDCVKPTHRRVWFDERHTLSTDADGTITDIVRIEYGDIVRQLAAPDITL